MSDELPPDPVPICPPHPYAVQDENGNWKCGICGAGL